MYGDLTPKGSPAENSSPNAFNLIETIICFSDWKIRIQLELVRRAIFIDIILFPPKQLNRSDVDNESPGGDGADLRQDFDEASLLGHDQAEAIHNRRHWDKLRYAAQPFWKEECRKECSR